MGNCYSTPGKYRVMIDEVVQNSPDRTEVHMEGSVPRRDLRELLISLGTNTHVKKLRLVKVGLDTVSALHLAISLRQNSTLTHVDLEEKWFTRTGIPAILRVLFMNQTRENPVHAAWLQYANQIVFYNRAGRNQPAKHVSLQFRGDLLRRIRVLVFRNVSGQG